MMPEQTIKTILRQGMGVTPTALEPLLAKMEYESKTVTTDYLAFLGQQIQVTDGKRKKDFENRFTGLSPHVGKEYIAVLLRDQSSVIAYSVGILVDSGDILYVIAIN